MIHLNNVFLKLLKDRCSAPTNICRVTLDTHAEKQVGPLRLVENCELVEKLQ